MRIVFCSLLAFCMAVDVLSSPQCQQPIDVKAYSKHGFEGSLVSWADADCKPRTALLVRNDKKDPMGHYGGYMREYSYYRGKNLRRLKASDSYYPGFGVTVNHYQNLDGSDGSKSNSSMDYEGNWKSHAIGNHHYIHEYSWDIIIGGKKVPTKVHWYFQTGRSHPIYSVSYDMSGLEKNSLRADSRSPYGDLDWDGSGKAVVDGLEWGDHYVFKTTSAPLKMSSSWDYSQRNDVPYVMAYSKKADAMQASVQTQTWTEQDAGGYWFGKNWGKTSENRLCEVEDEKTKKCNHEVDAHVMPEVWNWAYQTVNYQFERDPTAKRFAWGTNFGALGLEEYTDMAGVKRSGWPEQSYSVYVIFDSFSSKAHENLRDTVRDKEAVEISITGGELVSQGYDGVVEKQKIKLTPKGYDHRYGVWRVQVSSPKLAITAKSAPTSQKNPLDTFVLSPWAHGISKTKIRLRSSMRDKDGQGLYVSYDKDRAQLWISVEDGLATGESFEVQRL